MSGPGSSPASNADSNATTNSADQYRNWLTAASLIVRRESGCRRACHLASGVDLFSDYQTYVTWWAAAALDAELM